MSLTVKRVAQLVRQGEPGRYLDGAPGVRGLYLCVGGKSNAHWELRFELHGRARWMGLGSASTFDLATARERANEARRKLADKIDPLDARRAERAAQAVAAAKAITFKEAAQQYMEAHRSGWRSAKHGQQWANSLRDFCYPIIGHLPVAAIDTGLVLKILEQRVPVTRGHPAGTLWEVRRETANRVRGRIESVLAWAQVRGFRMEENPARWRGHLAEALPKAKAAPVEHHPALPYDELPRFMSLLRQREGVAARALEFLILTAARAGEVLGGKWAEIDLDQAMWTIPPERMKGGREHKVPLPPRAIELLRALPTEANNHFVFIGRDAGGGLSNTALAAVLRRLERGDVTSHGFRSSFSTWAAEQTNFAREVAEAALAHAIPDATERAYKRTTLFDKRRQLMESWAKYCVSPPQVGGAKVILLHS